METIKLITLIIFSSWKQNFKLVTLAILSISIGVALVVSVFNANESILEQFDYSNKLIQGKQSARIINKNNLNFKESSFSANTLKKLRDLDFTPVLEIQVFDKNTRQTFKILGVDFLNDYRFRQYDFANKDKSDESPKIKNLIDEDTGGLLIAQSTKEKLNWTNKSQTVFYGDTEVSVLINQDIYLKEVGIVKAEGGLIALADIRYLQKTFGEQGNFTSVDFKDIEPKKLKAQINLPSDFEIIDPSRRKTEIKNLTSAFRFNLQALSFIALLVAAYLISQTVFISFQRKTKTIGIIRVLGFSKKQAFILLLLESLMIGLIGVLLGCALGIVLSKTILETLQTTINELYFSVKSTELITSYKGILIGSIVGLFASTISGLPSSFLSLKVEPIINLRSNAFKNIDLLSPLFIKTLCLSGSTLLLLIALTQHQLFHIQNRYIGFAIAFLALTGFSLLAGLFLNWFLKFFSGASGWFNQLSSVRLSSNFIRLWIATGALICGLSMTISISIMIDSFRDTVKDWINETLQGDIYISSVYNNPNGLNPKIVETAKQWTEVKEIDYLSRHNTKINNKFCIVGGTNISSQLNQLNILESIEKHREKLLQENYILVSNTFAIKQKLQTGDSINIPTTLGNKKMTVAGIYQDYSSEHGYILMRRDLYTKLFNNHKISNIALHLNKKTDLDIVKSKLAQLDKSILNPIAIKMQTNSELKQTILKIFNQTFQISYLFFWIALCISIVTVSLTLFSCIEENEYLNQVSSYLGTTNQQIMSMEIAQGLMITFIAALLSVPGGYWLSYILQNTVNNNSFGWIIYLHLSWFNVLSICGLALLGALIGSIFPLLKISNKKLLNSSN